MKIAKNKITNKYFCALLTTIDTTKGIEIREINCYDIDEIESARKFENKELEKLGFSKKNYNFINYKKELRLLKLKKILNEKNN